VSPELYHHELGIRLARGETENISGEGIHTLEMVEKYELFDTSTYPLFNLVHEIVNNPDDTGQKIFTYLNLIQ
jgi:glycerol-3-phosphate dehydrogenase (NAD(P)+)